jgi:predicted nucleic acid-binding Zn ribbon protein
MKRKTKKPLEIKSVVETVLQKLQKKEQGAKGEIVKAWYAAIDSDAPKHAKPILLRKKVLTIEVDSSGWLYMLNLKKRDMLDKIRKVVGRDKIEDIRFRMGEIS